MSELDASLYHLQNTQSIAFKFFSESVKEIEKQIHSTASLNFFTTEQIDFIVLICDQFQKLVKLRSKSKLIDNLLTYNFPEFFKPAENSNAPAPEPAPSKIVRPVDQETENRFSFVCDICDEDVPILNNDLNLSTESHLSSPYHQEVVSVLRKINESKISTSSVASSSSKSTSVSALNNSAKVKSSPEKVTSSQKVVPNPKTLPSQSSKPTVSTISAEEESFQRFSWIQSQRQSQYLLWRHSLYFCCLCDVNLTNPNNFDTHVKSLRHKMNVATERNNAVANVGTSKMGENSCEAKQNGKNRVITRTKNISSDSKSQVGSDSQSSQIIVFHNGIRVCTLCNVRLPSEANFVSHVNSASHRTKSEIFLKTFDALTKALNVTNSAANAPSSSSAASERSCAVKNESSNTSSEFLVTRDGIQYCSLCNVKVPGKAQQDSHFNGSLHKDQLKATPKKPVMKSFTDFVINKDGKRYCILCNINLPGESQMIGHKYGKTHKQKMKEYEEKYLS